MTDEKMQASDNIVRLLSGLSLEQRMVVFDAIKEDIFLLLTDVYDEPFPPIFVALKNIAAVLQCLSLEQCTEALMYIKDSLSEKIITSDDIGTILRPLSPEQRSVVFEVIKDNILADFIQSNPHLVNTFGGTALLVAVANNRINVVQALLTIEGINVHQGQAVDKTPLAIAANNNFVEILRILLAHYLNQMIKEPESCRQAFVANPLLLDELVKQQETLWLMLLNLADIDVLKIIYASREEVDITRQHPLYRIFRTAIIDNAPIIDRIAAMIHLSAVTAVPPENSALASGLEPRLSEENRLDEATSNRYFCGFSWPFFQQNSFENKTLMNQPGRFRPACI